MIAGCFSGRLAGPRVSATRPRAARLLRRAAGSDDTSDAPKETNTTPLDGGVTVTGETAVVELRTAPKDQDAGKSTVASPNKGATLLQIVDGRFKDDRWDNKDGRWVLTHPLFKGADGETDWDKVLDAEIARRRMLEQTPIPSRNDDPVNFDTSEIPWWAWVKRFHLPEAEKLNGRAAMVGYACAIVVDQLTGVGLVDQQDSFLGKVLLHLVVFAVLLIRSRTDIEKYKGLIDEATFYDKQWNATWEGQTRPSETEN